MKLLLDLGNSRLKWGLVNGPAQPLQARGSASYGSEGLNVLATALDKVALSEVCYASVVDPAREAAVLSLLPPGIIPVRFVITPQFASLRNTYQSQQTLGIDRWAAAIGAWAKVNGACLVINAGTATTIDLIDMAQQGGIYRGGLILPGIDMMLQSLHQGTARLPDAKGQYRGAPDIADNTEDAMVSGVIEATCGAIERMGQRLPKGAPWLLTGGHAPTLERVLGQRVRLVEDLVLEGLAQV